MSLQKQNASFTESTLRNLIGTTSSVVSILQELTKINDTNELPSASKNYESDLVMHCKTVLPLVQSFEKKIRYTQQDSSSSISSDLIKGFDLKTTALWNLSVTVSKIKPLPVSAFGLCQVKHFASLLLMIHQSLVPIPTNTIRALKCLLKTESLYIDEQFYKESESLFDSNDICLKRIEQVRPKLSSTEKTVVDILKVDGSFIQMVMNLKLGNLEMARSIFKFTNIKVLSKILKCAKFLDYLIQLYNCSVDMFERSQYEDAIEWITITLDLAPLVEPSSSEEKAQLDVLLRSSNRLLIRSLCTNDPSKAASIVKDMEIRFPDATETFLSKFEVLDSLNASPEQYESTLMEFALSVDVASNIENTMFLFQHLDSRCNVFGSLDYIIANKLSFEEDSDLVTQILVTRIQLTIDSEACQPIDLVEFFSLLERKFEDSPPLSLIQSTTIMVWKKAQSLETDSFKRAAEWLETLNHPLIIGQIGESNVSKIERRLMFLYEKSDQWSKIPEKAKSMGAVGLNDVKTISHMVSYYLHIDDLENAAKCIDELCKSDDEQMAVVLALCISKARDMNKHYITVYAMKKMIDAIAQNKPINKDAINLPALVRSTIQLQLKSLGQSTKDWEAVREGDEESEIAAIRQSITDTLSMVKAVVAQSLHFCLAMGTIGDKGQSQEGADAMNRFRFTGNDVLWIASKSYYTALQAVKCLDIEMSIELSKLALELLSVEVDESGDYDGDQEKQRLIGICMVLLITSLRKKAAQSGVVQADEDSHDAVPQIISIELWREIRHLTQECQKIWKKLSLSDKTYSMDYVKKLLIYELDSCLHLHEWNHVKQIIQKAAVLSNMSAANPTTSKNEHAASSAFLIQCFVDLLLNSSALPLDTLVECLHLIVTKKLNAISSTQDTPSDLPSDENEMETAAKWVRVLVGLTLPGREEICSDMLAHFREFLKGQGKFGVPGQDIQWITTSCWNHGVYHKQLKHDDKSLEWCERSLFFARYVNERFERQLQEMYIKLMSA